MKKRLVYKQTFKHFLSDRIAMKISYYLRKKDVDNTNNIHDYFYSNKILKTKRQVLKFVIDTTNTFVWI